MTNDPETVRRLLERDLIDCSEDPDLPLIWADLLQLGGDPLGTLVVLDHVAASRLAPTAVAARAGAEAEALRKQLRARLWDESVPDDPGVTLIWRLGFVRELVISGERLRGNRSTRVETVGRLVPTLLRQPALRWLETLRIEVDDELADQWSRWLLRARPHNPTLREIHIGQPPQLRRRPAGSWETDGSSVGWNTLDYAVLQGLRQLRHLSIAGERIRLPCRDGNPQTRVHHVVSLATRPLTLEHRVALARALWDASVLVHRAAFEVACSLGRRAMVSPGGAWGQFLLDELAWFLRPPLSKKDPRPVAALHVLTAIGPASAGLLGEVLAQPQDVLHEHRIGAFMNWLTSLGPAAAAAQSLLDSLLSGQFGVFTPAVRKSITHARRAIASS